MNAASVGFWAIVLWLLQKLTVPLLVLFGVLYVADMFKDPYKVATENALEDQSRAKVVDMRNRVEVEDVRTSGSRIVATILNKSDLKINNVKLRCNYERHNGEMGIGDTMTHPISILPLSVDPKVTRITFWRDTIPYEDNDVRDLRCTARAEFDEWEVLSKNFRPEDNQSEMTFRKSKFTITDVPKIGKPLSNGKIPVIVSGTVENNTTKSAITKVYVTCLLLEGGTAKYLHTLRSGISLYVAPGTQESFNFTVGEIAPSGATKDPFTAPNAATNCHITGIASK